ncbi:hypothetical protein MKW98_001770 [Papaver atlanticum]|uniref:RRM domain-containing protein n=1 Tax=Papaver atlanticum TaxID=357466 RepID=A0AAD4S699_9MAGN|nr:hypothetical protein MKW98_001770 [Papaver atlanticum]
MSTYTMQTPGSVCWGDLEDDGQDSTSACPPGTICSWCSYSLVDPVLTTGKDFGFEFGLDKIRPPGSKNDTRVLGDPLAPGTSRSGTYIPPGQRDGARQLGSEMRPRRNEENSVRVTNLSEGTREPDLLELFRRFGAVSRVYIPVDRRTGMSRGFAFVNFVNKEDAERAINVLNGYGYDNLILGVQWATPREN